MHSRKLRLDLHTHSVASPDGSLRLRDYEEVLSRGKLDYIAITDHNRIDFALEAQRQLGPRIIVGEEINTTEGELIGLFLETPIEPGLSLADTARQIKAQGGVVYVPHPFETVRSGIGQVQLNAIADAVAIVEGYNGRAVFQDKGWQARRWAKQHNKAVAASSDSHGRVGWTHTYSVVSIAPSADNLADLLRRATYAQRRVGWGVCYPKFNRLRKQLFSRK